MNLQDIKTQLDALNKAVSEMENAEAKFTFTREQMERFVKHITSTLVQSINQSIDHEFEVDEDSIETDVNGGYGREFTIDLSIDNHEIRRSIKEIVECSYDDSGIMEEVENCYPAIVEPIVENTLVEVQD